jgi:hypothetical protein
MSTSGILPTSGTLHNNSIGNFEIPIIVRTWINDLDSSDYKYSDSRINQVICVAARFVQQDADFKTKYTIGLDYISPNPAELEDFDFINLVGLKTACIILGSELKLEAGNSISIKDGPSSIDLRGVSSTIQVFRNDICSQYNNYILDYKAGNSSAGQAVLGPYSPASEFVSRRYSDTRDGHYF